MPGIVYKRPMTKSGPASRRATKTYGPSAETREAVFQVAIREFKKRGVDGISMRELAKKCDLAPSHFYYYFHDKDDVVLEFYHRNFEGFMRAAREVLSGVRGFEDRLTALMRVRLETMAGDRAIYLSLSRSAMDPQSVLSPFGRVTAGIRNEAIALCAEVIRGSPMRVARSLEPLLPVLLWMYMMALIFFWIHDESESQRKSHALNAALTPMVAKGLKVLNLPLMGVLQRRILKLWTEAI